MARKKRRQSTLLVADSGGNSTTTSSVDLLAQAENEDLKDLLELAPKATVVEFNNSGRPHSPSYLPWNTFTPIMGLVKTSKLPDKLLKNLGKIHKNIQSGALQMAPWAGLEQDARRLRAFGFMGDDAVDKLRAANVRMHAMEKTGEEARLDAESNWNAACVLEGKMKELGRDATRHLISEITQKGKETDIPLKESSVDDLIAFQPNLHNGTRHLGAHLDYPLHEGFGKVLVTVAMKGNATILLTTAEGSDEQRWWRFNLNEGECYVLSGDAREKCHHAVIADEDSEGEGQFGRESLNLRIGLHTADEASEIVMYWQN